MSATSEEVLITIIAAISLFILFSGVVIRFLFLYQKKKFIHEEQLIEMEKKYREETLRSQLEVQEQTRIYIGRELHDNIGTLSSLIKINLNLADTTDSEEKKKEWMAESKEMVKTLITEVKQLSLDLNTDRLADGSLVSILQQDIRRLAKMNLFLIAFSVDGEEWSLPSDKKIILYRVCQELLHNIIKHARPANVTVDIKYTKEKVELDITDDGVGFDILTVSADRKEGPGSGLINMRNRIELIGGKIRIDSSPGNGAKCYIQVPFVQN